MKQIKSLFNLSIAGFIILAMGFLGTVKADPLKVGFIYIGPVSYTHLTLPTTPYV